MDHPVAITAFYLFTPLSAEELQELQSDLLSFGVTRDMRGLTLLATEGINGTVSGSLDAIDAWKNHLTDRFGPIIFKDSGADRPVFKRWSVKLKPEIVGLKRTDIVPTGKNGHLSPQEFHRMLQEEDVVVIDARNSYEYQIGKFRGALDCGTRSFHEFPEFAQHANLPKDKKVLMYCTGAIRCEKAWFVMKEQGYQNVYQLEGGILAYLKEFPECAFEGECFVFDRRCAVDQHLQPSETYEICPHCGLPGSELIECTACKTEQKVCSDCLTHEYRKTCSKRCAYDVKRTTRV